MNEQQVFVKNANMHMDQAEKAIQDGNPALAGQYMLQAKNGLGYVLESQHKHVFQRFSSLAKTIEPKSSHTAGR